MNVCDFNIVKDPWRAPKYWLLIFIKVTNLFVLVGRVAQSV
jgi:hypothetical protein